MFENNATGLELRNIPGLSLTSPMTIRNNTSRGIEVLSCEAPTLDNLVLTGNTGDGAVYMHDTGEFTLGSGNTIGGSGVENSWPVGLFTQHEALMSRSLPRETPVEQAMDAALLCLDADTPLHRVAAQAAALDARRVVTMRKGQMEGILTGIDLAQAVA